MQIVYRLTVYDDNNQPLVPVSGSGGLPPVHQDPFVVASAPISGSQPYIVDVSPNPGRAVIPDAKWQVGRYYIDIADVRTNTGNLERWITAFLGDATGRSGLVAKKALVEESLDNGTTWTPQFVGRVTQLENITPLKYTIQLSDESDRLKRTIFQGYPDPDSLRTSIRKTCLLPIAVLPVLGLNPALTFIHGKRTDQVELDEFGDPIDRSNFAEITVDRTAPLGFRIEDELSTSQGLIWTAQISEALNNFLKIPEEIGFRLELRPRLEAYIGGQLIGNYAVTGMQKRIENTPFGEIEFASKVYIARDRDDSLVFEDWDDFGVQFRIFAPNNEASLKDAPFFIDAVPSSDINKTVLGVVKDIFDGEYDNTFSLSSTGSYIPIVYDNNNLNNLFTNPQHAFDRSALIPITESKKINDFLEKDILRAYGAGYYLEPKVINNQPVSEFRLFSLARPAIPQQGPLDLPEIIFDDVIASEMFDWQMEKPYKITITSAYPNFLRITPTNTLPFSLQENTVTFVDRNALIADTFNELSYKDYSFTTSVLRGLDVIGRPFKDVTNRFTRASSTLKIVVRRGVYENIRIGDFVYTTIDWQPNTSTFRRGGTKIMQVISKLAKGTRLEFELLDSGIALTALAPTLGTPTLLSEYGASISITGQEFRGVVSVDYAIRNSNTAPTLEREWITLDRFDLAQNTTVTRSVSNLPRNKWIFFRARTETSTRLDGLMLPSSYVVSSGLQLPALAAPTGLTISNLSLYTADISWNPSKIFFTEVWHTGNSAGTLQLYNTYPPNTSTIIATGFEQAPSASQTVSIRFTDNSNNISGFTSTTFTRGSTGRIAPDLGGIFIFNDLFL